MLQRTMIAIAAVCTGTIATAQTDYWRNIAYSPLIALNQIVTATVAGNFTGYHTPDVAMLLGGRVALCTAPAIHNAITPLTDVIGATGLANMPRGTHGRDGLAIATSTGLYQWTIDSTALTTIESGVAWRLVACADLDGFAPHDLIGAVGNDTLRVLLRNGTSTTVLQRTFTGEIIAHVLPVQWDGAGAPEIAVATNARLWIGSQTTPVTEFPAANVECQVARVGMASNRDHVAWWRRDALGESTLDVVSALGTMQYGATAIGTVHYLTAGGGDFANNKAPDLLVCLQGSSSMRIVTNTADPAANVATFDLEQPVVESPFSGLQPVNPAFGAAWYGDLNGDDQVDTFAPLMWGPPEAVSSVAYVRLGWLAQFRRPKVGNPIVVSQVGDQRTFTLPLTALPDGILPTGATHLELLPFGARVRSGTFATMTTGLPRVRVSPSASSIAFTVTVDALTPPSFVGVVRWIALGQDNIVCKAWPSSKFVVATDANVPAYETWLAGRLVETTTPPQFLWMSGFPVGSLPYVNCPIALQDNGGIYTATSGDEEPPDLPPPPPVPPKPPTPPPDGDGNGGGG